MEGKCIFCVFLRTSLQAGLRGHPQGQKEARRPWRGSLQESRQEEACHCG